MSTKELNPTATETATTPRADAPLTRPAEFDPFGAEAPGSAPPARELKITAQNHINYILDHALPLCIILAHEQTHPWLHQSYVTTYSLHLHRHWTSGFRVLELGAPDGEVQEEFSLHFQARPAEAWLHQFNLRQILDYTPEDIIAFVVGLINRGCYARVEVDESLLPGKKAYGKLSYVHPTLVYGYDDEARTLSCVGFDINGYFTKITFAYQDFRKAYAAAVRIIEEKQIKDSSPVTVIRPRKMRDKYPFSVAQFCHDLDGYLNSVRDPVRSYRMLNFLPQGIVDAGDIKFGFSMYEHFDAGLEGLFAGRQTLEYRDFHLLYEHKKALAGALRFISAEYGVRSRLVELTGEVEQLAHQFHAARWKAIRAKYTRDARRLREAAAIVRTARGEERTLLARVHEQLRADFDLK